MYYLSSDKVRVKVTDGVVDIPMKSSTIALAFYNSYEFSRIRLHGVVLFQTPLGPSVHHMTRDVTSESPLLIL